MATGLETQTLAWNAYQSGNLAEAQRLFRQALRVDPRNADAWCLLGIVCKAAGELGAAVAAYREALQLRPGFVEAFNNLGNVLSLQGQHDEALSCYQQALRLRPDHAQAHNNLGAVLRKQGKLDEAAASYREALRLVPHYADAHNNLGDVLSKRGQTDEAVACYREALRLRPDFPEALTNLGVVLVKQGKHDEAVAHHRHAVRLRPNYAEAHNNLGNALLEQARPTEAETSYREALRLRPDYPEALANLGIALARQHRLDEAAASYERALQLRPDYPEAIANLGNVLLEQGQPEAALARYQAVLGLEPESSTAHYNSSQAYLAQGRFDAALAGFDHALALQADYAEAHMGRAITWLKLGDFERGWVEYEWRWKCKDNAPLPYTQPLWDGSPLAGRTILLHAEQGLGDALQYLRYAPLVRARGGTVVVACQKPLLPLLASCPGIDRLVAQDAELPPFDVYAPLLSLPRVLGTTLATIPAPVPYVFADTGLVEHWRRELRPYRGFRIGIAWQGNPQFGADRQRSLPLAHFATVARVPGTRLFSLQKGPGTEQIQTLPEPFPLIDLGPRLDEAAGAFMDTAAVMRNLDLVISSDTAVAHLAGALGVPVWLALPYTAEWRWLLQRDDSPWYPTMRLFRQSRPTDWPGVFAHLAAALRAQMPKARPLRVPVAVSPGELLDRIARLEVEAERCTEATRLRNVRTELARLTAARDRALPSTPELGQLAAEFKAVNETLWQIEADLRRCEHAGDFGPAFLGLVRAGSHHKERRAACKQRVNGLHRSRAPFLVGEREPYAP